MTNQDCKKELNGILGDLLTLSKMAYELAEKAHNDNLPILPILMSVSRNIDATVQHVNDARNSIDLFKKTSMPRTTNDKGNHAVFNIYQQPSEKS